MTASDLANKVLILGIPAAIGLCGWGLTEIINNGKLLGKALGAIESQQRELGYHDMRINRLEGKYFR